MSLYFGETEMQGLHFGDMEITGLYFGETEIWAAWAEYDGTLPAQYSANGYMLADYRIYGASGGVGDRTKNLFDKNAEDTVNGYVNNKYLTSNGVVNDSSSFFISEYMPITGGENYALYNAAPLSNAAAICFYTSEKVYISGVGYASQETVAVTAPANAAYARATVYKPQTNVMLTPGDSAPAEYVPYGYEVDMGVQSANLFDADFVRGSYRSSDGVFQDSTNYITNTTKVVVESEAMYTINFKSSFSGDINREYAFFWNIQNQYVGAVAMNNHSFSTPASAAYCSISIGSTTSGLLPSDISEFMLVEGSASLPYQPYSNITTPIYIGDEPLEADEYVDYVEQKVYRRTVNRVGIFANLSLNGINYHLDGSELVMSGTAGATIGANNDAYKNSFKLFLAAGTYSLEYWIEGEATGTINASLYKQDKTLIRAARGNFTLAEDTQCFIGFFVANGVSINIDMALSITEGSVAPSTYIPYLQPTDPPVPLPALPTVDGVAITDYAGQSVAPSRFYAKYKKGGQST